MTFHREPSRPAAGTAPASLLQRLDTPAEPMETMSREDDARLTDRIGAILGRRTMAPDQAAPVAMMAPPFQGMATRPPAAPILANVGWVLGGAGLCGCLLLGVWAILAPAGSPSLDSTDIAAIAAQQAQADIAPADLDKLQTASVRSAELPTAVASVSGDDAKRTVDAQRLKDELAALRVEQAQAQKRVADQREAAGAMTLAGLVSGTFPAEWLTPPLDDLRRRYADAQLIVDQLQQALGPRHPRLQAAQGQADVLKADLERQLRAIAAEARATLKQDEQQAQALAVRNAELTASLKKAQVAPAARPVVATSDDRRLVTASIPAAAIRPPADPAPIQQQADAASLDQPMPPQIDAETTVTGLMGILVLAIATGGLILGLGRFGRRKLGLVPHDSDSVAMKQEPAAHLPALEPSPVEGTFAKPQMTDLAELRLDIAALRQRVHDFSERRYRQSA